MPERSRNLNHGVVTSARNEVPAKSRTPGWCHAAAGVHAMNFGMPEELMDLFLLEIRARSAHDWSTA